MEGIKRNDKKGEIGSHLFNLSLKQEIIIMVIIIMVIIIMVIIIIMMHVHAVTIINNLRILFTYYNL